MHFCNIKENNAKFEPWSGQHWYNWNFLFSWWSWNFSALQRNYKKVDASVYLKAILKRVQPIYTHFFFVKFFQKSSTSHWCIKKKKMKIFLFVSFLHFLNFTWFLHYIFVFWLIWNEFIINFISTKAPIKKRHNNYLMKTRQFFSLNALNWVVLGIYTPISVPYSLFKLTNMTVSKPTNMMVDYTHQHIPGTTGPNK